MKSFERYETDDGEEYFVEVGTGVSVWNLPSDGKVVEQNSFGANGIEGANPIVEMVNR